MSEEKKIAKKNETKENPYENMCFVMMPISDKDGYDKGHFTKIYEQIFQPAIKAAGYEPYRVDENKISDSIIIKIFEAIQNTPMALCDLSSNNPNVLYELGLRQAYDKPVVLVKDDNTNHIFDIGGINTIQYHKLRLYENVKKAKEDISQAIMATKANASKYSLVNMIKANKAIIDNGSIAEDDATQIMLRKIVDEIKELKINNNAKSNINNSQYLIEQILQEQRNKKIIENYKAAMDSANKLSAEKFMKEYKKYFSGYDDSKKDTP